VQLLPGARLHHGALLLLLYWSFALCHAAACNTCILTSVVKAHTAALGCICAGEGAIPHGAATACHKDLQEVLPSNTAEQPTSDRNTVVVKAQLALFCPVHAVVSQAQLGVHRTPGTLQHMAPHSSVQHTWGRVCGAAAVLQCSFAGATSIIQNLGVRTALQSC